MTADSTENPGLERLNAMSAQEAFSALHAVCGSRCWAEAMVAARPFASASAVLEAAGKAWVELDRGEWLEAFSHHPRIGERKLEQPKFAATREQSGREQSGMAAASDEVRREFEALNERYEQRFGHVFLICAAGKSAEFMLEQIRQRIGNSGETEMINAAGEQAKIIRLRLERMLKS